MGSILKDPSVNIRAKSVLPPSKEITKISVVRFYCARNNLFRIIHNNASNCYLIYNILFYIKPKRFT